MSRPPDVPGARETPEPFPFVGTFVSARDPVDGNPFPVSHPLHKDWSAATRKAEDEVSRLTPPAPLEAPRGQEWSGAVIAGQFEAWARRGAGVVWSDRAFAHYEQWLIAYAGVCVHDVARRFDSVAAPDADGRTLWDLEQRLDVIVNTWRAAARRVCLTRQSAPRSGPPDAAWARFVERFLQDNPFPADHPAHPRKSEVSQQLAHELASIDASIWSDVPLPEAKTLVDRLAGWTQKYFDVLAQARLIVIVINQSEDALEAYRGELEALRLQALRAADDLQARVAAQGQILMMPFPGATDGNLTCTALLAALNERLLEAVTSAVDTQKGRRWIQACFTVRNPDHFPAPRMSPDPAHVAEAAPLTLRGWDAVEIQFLSDLKFQAVVGGIVQEPQNYADVGFGDRRGHNMPKAAWDTLRRLAESRGVLSSGDTAGDWRHIEKHMQEIRKRLRAHFQLEGDPVPYREGAYRARFTIGVRAPYDR
jgi:hypothetical protein